MRKGLLAFTAITAMITNQAWAQQDKLITHFMYDKMSVNPGETGIDQGICGTLIYRNQWDKVNGAPNSVVFNAAANLERWIPGGVGISFYHDAIGFNRYNNVNINYSHHLEIVNVGMLGIGLGAGIMNFSQSPVWVTPSGNVDPTLPTGFAATGLDLNGGLYFKANSGWYAGISSTHLSQSRLSQSFTGPNGINLIADYQPVRHYYAMGGYTIKNIGNGDIETNALVRTEFKKVSFDVNGRYIWNSMLYGGLTYRNNDAVGIMVGYFPMKNMTIGYNYDITTNKLAGISRGSHEIMVKYCYLLPPVPIQKSKHPRWL